MSSRVQKHIENTVCLIPTWLCARHALGAYKSFRKYYPDLPVYFVDDEFTEEGKNDWGRVYGGIRGANFYDPDSTKLVGLHNAAYIRVPHEGFETEGHGLAVTKGMKLIHSKWILHLSSDIRIVKKGVLEYMLNGATNKCAGVGMRRDVCVKQYPNLNKTLCLFRGDLYHKYNLNFYGDLSQRRDAGTMMFKTLVDKGYYLNNHLGGGFEEYFVHLRWTDQETWKKYY